MFNYLNTFILTWSYPSTFRNPALHGYRYWRACRSGRCWRRSAPTIGDSGCCWLRFRPTWLRSWISILKRWVLPNTGGILTRLIVLRWLALVQNFGYLEMSWAAMTIEYFARACLDLKSRRDGPLFNPRSRTRAIRILINSCTVRWGHD